MGTSLEKIIEKCEATGNHLELRVRVEADTVGNLVIGLYDVIHALEDGEQNIIGGSNPVFDFDVYPCSRRTRCLYDRERRKKYGG